MSKLGGGVLAACLFPALLQACSSYSDPAARDFTQVEQRPAKAQETGNTLETAEFICRAETEQKGIASIAAIYSRFRQGSADKDYIACMNDRGFEETQ